MNHNKERRRLIWKYFWKRKRQEIWDNLKETWFIYLYIVCVFSGVMAAALFDSNPENIFIYIFFGLIICALIINIMLMFFYIIKKLVKWIRSNWRLASHDAAQELNKRRRER